MTEELEIIRDELECLKEKLWDYMDGNNKINYELKSTMNLLLDLVEQLDEYEDAE